MIKFKNFNILLLQIKLCTIFLIIYQFNIFKIIKILIDLRKTLKIISQNSNKYTLYK